MSEKRSQKDFDREGEVLFKDFDFNYFVDGPLVLRSMNFKIQPGEKIGIGKLFYLLFCNNLYLRFILLSIFLSLESWTNWSRKEQSDFSIVSNKQWNIW